MNTKRIVGLVILIVGIIAIIYGGYQKRRITEAQGNVQKGTSLFSGNSASEQIGQSVGGAIENKITSYNAPVMMLMIGGIILAIIGGGMFLCCGKKRKR